jgi:hypothetical protein
MYQVIISIHYTYQTRGKHSVKKKKTRGKHQTTTCEKERKKDTQKINKYCDLSTICHNSQFTQKEVSKLLISRQYVLLTK